MSYMKSRTPTQGTDDPGTGEDVAGGLSLPGLLGNGGWMDFLQERGVLSSPSADPCQHEVVPGDTLWGISKQVFGSGTAWPDLYDRNKTVVGDDPNLIYPGQNINVCGGNPTSSSTDQALSSAGQGTSPVDPQAILAARNKDLTMEEYLQILGKAESQYTAPDVNGNAKSSMDFVSSMRALYGYEGGNWESMIPDAPNVQAPDLQTYADLKDLYEVNADGSMKMEKDAKGNEHPVLRGVTTPDGKPIDPGHIFTGIDAVQHPKEGLLMELAGVDNQDGATWSGDVGQAIALHEKSGKGQGNTTEQSFNRWASPADLNADLDGVVLGHGYDQGKGLTEQLRAYYLDPTNKSGYQHRYSQFCGVRGLGNDGKNLNASAKGDIAQQTHNFADPYGGSYYAKDSATSIDMNARFVQYLESGLQGESQATP